MNYAYRIMNHENEFNQILRGGGIFQQYFVDMAAKIEGDNLRIIRMNPISFHSTIYKDVTDELNKDDDFCNIDSQIIISSIFVGEPVYIME